MTVPQRSDRWRKSSYSAEETNCVEVALDVHAEVRDTKDREGGTLVVPTAAWAALLSSL